MICKYCGKNRKISDFQSAGVMNGVRYFRKKCTECKDADQKKRMDSIRLKVIEFKKTHPCVHCGFSDYRGLQFHHRIPSEKSFEIPNGVRHGYSWKIILQEILKCDVLCANCHFIEHYQELDNLSVA